MERRLCQAVGGQGGGSWTPLKGWVLHGALEHPNKAQTQPGTLPPHAALCQDCGLTWSLTRHTHLDSLVQNKNLPRGKSLGLNKNRFKKGVIKHRALL